MHTINEHIRLLAIYFTDAQLTEVFGIRRSDIIHTFKGINRPKANPIALPILLARLSEVASAFVEPQPATPKNIFTEAEEKLITELSKPINGIDFLSDRRQWLSEQAKTLMTNRLNAGGVHFVWEIVQKNKDQLKDQCNIGAVSVGHIEQTLLYLNLSLGMSPRHPAIVEARRRSGFDATHTQPTSN